MRLLTFLAFLSFALPCMGGSRIVFPQAAVGPAGSEEFQIEFRLGNRNLDSSWNGTLYLLAQADLSGFSDLSVTDSQGNPVEALQGKWRLDLGPGESKLFTVSSDTLQIGVLVVETESDLVEELAPSFIYRLQRSDTKLGRDLIAVQPSQGSSLRYDAMLAKGNAFNVGLAMVSEAAIDSALDSSSLPSTDLTLQITLEDGREYSAPIQLGGTEPAQKALFPDQLVPELPETFATARLSVSASDPIYCALLGVGSPPLYENIQISATPAVSLEPLDPDFSRLLSGPWDFYNASEGDLLENGPLPLALSQDRGDLELALACGGGESGTGTVFGTTVFLTFPTPDGVAELSGKVKGYRMSGTYSIATEKGTWHASPTGRLDCTASCNPIAVQRFVKTDICDLDKVWRISKFRSGAGHDYSDQCESCRSMKHYIQVYEEYRGNNIVDVHSPVDGLVVRVEEEQHGFSGGLINQLVTLRSSSHPDYLFVLHHIDLASAEISPGKTVSEGERLGTARIWYPEINDLGLGFDIGVSVLTRFGRRWVSYFETMEDSLFARYVARGVPSRADLSFSREERDAQPLNCLGEAFVDGETHENYFFLDPP